LKCPSEDFKERSISKMGYYDLSKKERQNLVRKMESSIQEDLKIGKNTSILLYSSDYDVYIRNNVSHILGRTYHEQETLRKKILMVANELLQNHDPIVRQTSIYLLGEIGKKDADVVFDYLETGLRDPHHKVRNAVMSALKVMGEKNPEPTLKFAEGFMHDPNPEVRKKVIHGIELRGRTHPEDILPLLEKVQDEKNQNVRKMIIHVLGQISYKKGCLEKVANALKTWHNQEIVQDTIPYIIEVHKNYPFSLKHQKKLKNTLKKHF
jgi:3-methyladenine DNA glycosylase AlkC